MQKSRPSFNVGYGYTTCSSQLEHPDVLGKCPFTLRQIRSSAQLPVNERTRDVPIEILEPALHQRDLRLDVLASFADDDIFSAGGFGKPCRADGT